MAKIKFDPAKPVTVTLGPDIRFLWPYLFEKRPNDDGEEKYEVLVQIPYDNKEAIERIEAAVDEAIRRGYSGELGDKSTFKKGTKESSLKLPLKDGADREGDDYGDLFKGYMYLTAKSGKRKPTVVDLNCQEILDSEEVYSGMIGAISVTVYPYNNRSQGVGVQINHVQKRADGERISGGAPVTPEDAFAEYGTGEERPVRGRVASRSRDRVSDDPMFS